MPAADVDVCLVDSSLIRCPLKCRFLFAACLAPRQPNVLAVRMGAVTGRLFSSSSLSEPYERITIPIWDGRWCVKLG